MLPKAKQIAVVFAHALVALCSGYSDTIDYDTDELCGENVLFSRETPEYTIESPGYPLVNYADHLQCRWNFTSLEHHKVHVAVEKISMKGVPSPHCLGSDQVTFVGPMGSTIGKICLQTHKAPPISMRNFSVKFNPNSLPAALDSNTVYGFRILLTGTST